MHGQSKLSPNQTGQYFFYHGFFSHTLTFTQASRKRDGTFHFHWSTNIQTFSYRDVYSLFLTDVFAVTRLIADELYPPLGFAFNLTRTNLFWGLEDWVWDLVDPRNLKLNNSAKKYHSLKRVGRNIVYLYNKSKCEKNIDICWHHMITSSVISWCHMSNFLKVLFFLQN